MRVSIYTACSADGFVAAPDGGISFLNVVQGGPDYGMTEFLGSVDTLIMGRATLQTVLGFGAWPYDGLRVFVASSSLTASPHPQATLVSGEPADLLAAVGDAAHVWVDGPDTARRFLAAGLADDITVTTIPVLLGAGIPFFGPQERPIPLELVSSRCWDDGVVQTVYEPKR